jgi:plastocyanin
MRKTVLFAFALLMASSLGAERRTLPAAASIVGGAPFFSDVRAFNTSYTASLNVTATYRCFIPSPCTGVANPVVQFTLAPRQSIPFNDMVEETFGAPDTAGGVEFDHSGLSDQLVVTSRLFSTEPQATVGMFIPGLDNSFAHVNTVLTSIRNRGPDAGFRTNVGVFNPEDFAVNVTFAIFSNTGAAIGGPVTISVAAHSGAQVSRIFDAAQATDTVTGNAVVRVTATGEVFSYAAVIDNATTDPIFVVGAEDQAPSAAPVNRIVQVGQGGLAFVDNVNGGQVTTINVGDTVTWVWAGGLPHAVTAGTCTGGGGGYVYGGGDDCSATGQFQSGNHSAPFEWSHTFSEAGSFRYFCSVHESAMTARVVVGSGAGSATRKRRPR